MQKSISVVIPNYNGKDLLHNNLPTVYKALSETKTHYEIIVVDDASTDDSVDFLHQNFKDVIVLRNEINKGFSPTINRGIMIATQDLVLLLNSDVLLLPNFFEPLFQYFDSEDTFGVSGRFIGLHDDKIQEAGKYPALSYSKKIQPYNFFIENPSGWVPTLYLSAGAALVDRKKLTTLGGFDEIFAPYYLEDTDLSIRAWRVGWRCYYEHRAICRHPASTTINKFNKRRKIWIFTQRNKLVLHSLHLSRQSKWIWYSRQAITLVIQAIALRWKYHIAFFYYLEKRSEVRKSKEKFSKVFSGTPSSLEAALVSIKLELDTKRINKL